MSLKRLSKKFRKGLRKGVKGYGKVLSAPYKFSLKTSKAARKFIKEHPAQIAGLAGLAAGGGGLGGFFGDLFGGGTTQPPNGAGASYGGGVAPSSAVPEQPSEVQEASPTARGLPLPLIAIGAAAVLYFVLRKRK